MSKKQKIFFGDLITMYSYSYALSSIHQFKSKTIKLQNIGGQYEQVFSLQSDMLDLILLSEHSMINENIIETMFSLCNLNDIFIYDLFHYMNSLDTDNTKINLKKISEKLNVVLIDQNGECYKNEIDFENEYKKITDLNNNIFILSNRCIGGGERISTKNYIMNLVYYYHFLSDNLNIHPTIPYNDIIKKEYDFISYIGLEYNKPKGWRCDIIDMIDFSDKKVYLPNSFKNLNYIQNEMKSSYNYPQGNLGSYILYSILESQTSKIKIVFETEYYHQWDLNKIYFTEKTLKCLMYEQPYFLICHRYLYEELEKYGFKIPHPKTINEIIKNINSICEYNVDEWASEHNEIFIDNKNHFYDLVYSPTLPHTKQLMEWGILK